MIKRTIYLGNPSKLFKKNEQLILEQEANEYYPLGNNVSIPIEDLGVLILDHYQISLTIPLLNSLLENNTAIITCNGKHMPFGMFLPLEKHHTQQERFENQIAASLPLKKNLWAQIITQKLYNQGELLRQHNKKYIQLWHLSKNVKSGDIDNLEAQGAAFYWKNIFELEEKFKREQDGDYPNDLLNYGYAILRAIAARSLVGSGLLPTLGLFHSNKYNAYCLADDIMEPYRPFVDAIVLDIIAKDTEATVMLPWVKKQLIGMSTIDVVVDKQRSPLMVAMQRTTASLAKCYEGSLKKLVLPQFI